MFRIGPYRGFEIHVTLEASSEDLYDVSFQILGGSNLSVLGASWAVEFHFVTARSRGAGPISSPNVPNRQQ
ncbi:hypothetical protein [Caballeronia sp. Lep1P3]|uniref:hypothetical protein n=1 Tax=Caballeronia sp. Lep1P3 TaxID=2878150 RepID=UPI00351D517F